jgi:hypothetical protein
MSDNLLLVHFWYRTNRRKPDCLEKPGTVGVSLKQPSLYPSCVQLMGIYDLHVMEGETNDPYTISFAQYAV